MAERDASEAVSGHERRRRIEERICHAEERARLAEARYHEALQEADQAPNEALAERHRAESELHRAAMVAQLAAAQIQREHLLDLELDSAATPEEPHDPDRVPPEGGQ